MQTKNLIAFIIVSALIIVGSFYIQHQLWPPQPPKPKEEAKKESKEKKAAEEKAKKEAKAKESAHGQETPPFGFWAAWLEPMKEELKPLQVPRTTKADEIPLGGDENSPYHLKVILTRLGGGVHSLELNKFEGAGPYGKGTGKRLELIPPDAEYPSYLFYDYPQPEPDAKEGKHPANRLGRVKWEVEEKDLKAEVQKVTFRTEVAGFIIHKTYELAPHTYHLGLTIEVERKDDDGGPDVRTFRYQLDGPHGLPIEGGWYTSIFRNVLIGRLDPNRNLYRKIEDSARIAVRGGGDREPDNELGDNRLQYAMVATQYFASGIVVDNKAGKENDFPPRYLEWARGTLESTDVKVQIISVNEKARQLLVRDQEHIYPVHVAQDCLIDITSADNTIKDLKAEQVVYVTYRPTDGEPPAGPVIARDIRIGSKPPRPQFADVSVAVNSVPLSLTRGGREVHKYLLYSGPVKVRLLGQFSGDKAVPADLVTRYEDDLHLNTLTDYHSDSWIGRFSNTIHWTALLIAVTNLMHWLLGLLHWILPVYGLNIILLTVMVRGLMFPISRKQAYISMKMQALAPEMKKIQEKYKSDPQARTRATMDLYRRHGVNPLGGCLPLVLQLPIFLGLYYALQESIFFRLAGFLWIDNLAAPDMLFWWGEGIPFVSGFLGPFFNLLPVVAVSLMIVQQKMMTPPAQDDQQAFQQKLMKYMMVFFGIMFYKVAAGLCLYFIASSLWGVAERKLLPKRGPLGALPPAAGGGPGKTAKLGRPAPSRGPKGKRVAKEQDGAFQKVKDWWADWLKQAKKK